MQIGIIGLGVVGSACKTGFEILGHTVKFHDPKYKTNISDLKDTEISYICVPTPNKKDDSCDISIVEKSIKELENIDYQGIVAMRSTNEPGTIDYLQSKTHLRLCVVPEFLRERYATEDFIKNHNLLVVGCYNTEVFNTVVKSHGIFPKHIKMMTPTEAEILKYYSNVYNALRIVFANLMYEVCETANADYGKIKDAFLLRGTSSGAYLDCNSSLRGFGGMCLPKDTKALNAFLKKHNIDFSLLDSVLEDNAKVKSTVFPGMRE
jgi:UDPglucose 6-dehydrogenase